jgi:hypothetical protein
MILLAQNYEFGLERPRCWEWVIFQSSCKAPFKNPAFAYPIFLGCLVCLIIAIMILCVSKPKIPITLKSIKHTPADLMNYVLPYVVSFMSIDYQETGKFVGFLIFMAWMFWITHASGHVILNPILIVFKWRLYEVTYIYPGDKSEHTGRALSKVALSINGTYRHAMIQDVIIIKSSAEES